MSSILSVTWVLCSAVHRKDIFRHPAPTLVQSGERNPEMYFRFTAERRNFETHITDQTLSSVMAARMWSYLTPNSTKCKSLTGPLMTDFRESTKETWAWKRWNTLNLKIKFLSLIICLDVSVFICVQMMLH